MNKPYKASCLILLIFFDYLIINTLAYAGLKLANSQLENNPCPNKFEIKLNNIINTKQAQNGAKISGYTTNEFYLDNELIPLNSKVQGHIIYIQKARKLLKSEFSKDKWLHSGGYIGLEFDRIITPNKTLITIAKPAPKTKVIQTKNLQQNHANSNQDNLANTNDNSTELNLDLKVNQNSINSVKENIEYQHRSDLIVNNDFLITPSILKQVKNNAIPMGIHTAAMLGGVISMGILPLAYGAAGAVKPSFVLRHEITPDQKHPRLKAFGIGFSEGLPGGFLIAGAFIDGDEAILLPGDKITLTTDLNLNLKATKSTQAELIHKQ